jgi:hypothetical protein
MTPYQAWYSDKPDLSRLRGIGSKGKYLVPRKQRKKIMDPRTRPCLLLDTRKYELSDAFIESEEEFALMNILEGKIIPTFLTVAADETEPFEPKTLRQAMNHSSWVEWEKAMLEEVNSHKQNKIWDNPKGPERKRCLQTESRTLWRYRPPQVPSPRLSDSSTKTNDRPNLRGSPCQNMTLGARHKFHGKGCNYQLKTLRE